MTGTVEILSNLAIALIPLLLIVEEREIGTENFWVGDMYCLGHGRHRLWRIDRRRECITGDVLLAWFFG